MMVEGSNVLNRFHQLILARRVTVQCSVQLHAGMGKIDVSHLTEMRSGILDDIYE